MSIKTKIKENAILATMAGLAAVSASAIGVWKGIVFADTMVMTEAEAGVIHSQHESQMSELSGKIDTIAALNTCRWLSDQISALEYEIYVLKRDAASPDFIHSKQSTLNQRKGQFDALNCAKLLLP